MIRIRERANSVMTRDPPRARLFPGADRSAPFQFEHMSNVQTPGPQSGRQSENHTGDERDAKGEN